MYVNNVVKMLACKALETRLSFQSGVERNDWTENPERYLHYS